MSVVLITGCSSGFGLETALAFARRGDRVFATMRNTEKASALRTAAESEGLEVEIASLDVTDGRSLEHAVTEVLKQGGFTRVRRATETPFNLILEARP